MRIGFIGVALLLATGCGRFTPVPMNTDPNREHQERLEQRTDAADIEAFIAAHPEFDEATRHDLRAGTLSRSDALRKRPTR